ncbi:MAG: hypothetical protein FJ125_04570, partial [Deltaproteobacteria bacterium]|nr:hypothetical protein [Deltaproteobacteria bacterium]
MSWLWKKKSTAGVLALLVLPLLLPSQEATAQRKAKVGKGRPAAAAPAPGALPREATEAPEAPAADAAAAAPGAPAELPPPAPDPAALPGSPEQPAAPAVPPAQPATVPEEVDVQPARTEAPVGTAGLTTPAEPAPGALGELQLVPLAGFGWYKTSADREETRAAFGYGLEVSWHDGPLAVGGALLHRSYDRGYRGTGPAPEGGGPQRLMLEEQELGGHLAVSYDLAPLLEITRFGLSAAPYGGVLA